MNHWPVTQNTLGWFCKFHLLFDHFSLFVRTHLDTNRGLCKDMYSKCLCCTWHTLKGVLLACVQFLRFLSELYSSSPLLCDWTLTFASSIYSEHVTCMSATFYERKIPWNLTTCWPKLSTGDQRKYDSFPPFFSLSFSLLSYQEGWGTEWGYFWCCWWHWTWLNCYQFLINSGLPTSSE